jgi:hypothetical protein
MTMQINIIGRGRGAEDGMKAEGEKWAVCIPRPGADLMFSMHPATDKKAQERRRQAEAMGIPVITPDSYPFGEVVSQTGAKYFPESVSYMIAMAVCMYPPEIHLWGCNADPKTDDYIIPKRPGVDFWIGFAMGRGSRVYINGQRANMEPEKIYGY